MTSGGGAPPRPSTPAAQRALVARWLAAVAGSVAVYGIAVAAAPFAPIDPHASALAAGVAYFVGFAAVAGMTIATGAFVPIPGRAGLGALLAIALAVGALAIFGIPAGSRAVAIGGGALVIALLLAGGGLAGALVGTRIQHPGHLSVVVIASSIADLWSVLSPDGPSAAVAEQAPLLAVLALSFPMIGTSAIEPLLGVGDVVFVALYLSASRRFDLGVGRTAAALAVAFVATSIAVLVFERALPALPFLGIVILIAHREARLPPPKERRTAALALGILAAVVAAVLLLRR